MAASRGGFAISIRATDEVTEQVEKIKKSLYGLGKTAKQVSDDQGPVHRIAVQARAVGIVTRELGERGAKALETFGRAAESVGSKIGSFAPALGALTSVATLAGIGELSRRAAEFGGSLTRNSAQIGLSIRDVQLWSRAMTQAGLSAEQAAGMLQNVNKAAVDINAGVSGAFGIADKYHINTKGGITETILSIADAVKKLHDEGHNPYESLQILNAFGIPAEALAELEKGRVAMTELLKTAGSLSAEDVKKLEELEKAYRDVSTSAGNFGSKIIADVATPLEGASRAAQSFLDELRKSPEALKAVEVAVTALGSAIAVGLTAKIAGVVASFIGLSGLAASAGVGAIAGGAAVGSNQEATNRFGFWQQAMTPFGFGPLGAMFSGAMGAANWLFGVKPNMGFGAGKKTSAASPAGAASPISFDPGEMGAAQYAIDMIESRGGTSYNNAPYPGHSATGRRQIIPSTFRMYAQPGERIDNEADNVAVSNRLIASLWDKYHDWDKVAYSYANGSPDAPDRNPGYVSQFQRYFRQYGGSAAGAGSSLDAGYNAAKARGSDALESWMNNVYATTDTTGMDTKHEVTIHVANAPAGTRTQVTSANGPASLNLRTSYSMADPF